MTIKLEEGKKYISRKGYVYGPLKRLEIDDPLRHHEIEFTARGPNEVLYAWTKIGLCRWDGLLVDDDLVAEYADAVATLTKADLLDKAKEAVADRGLNYGKPEDNFARIAAFWNVYLRSAGVVDRDVFGPADVAQMMVLMKMARIQNQPDHLDSWVDIAGYAACGAEISCGP